MEDLFPPEFSHGFSLKGIVFDGDVFVHASEFAAAIRELVARTKSDEWDSEAVLEKVLELIERELSRTNGILRQSWKKCSS